MFDFRLVAGNSVSAFLIAIAAGLGCFSAIFPSLAQQGDSSVRRGPDYWHPGWMRHDRWSSRSVSPEMRARMQRHRTFMHAGVPLAYRGLQSTVSMTQDTIRAGGKLYITHCASCHGERGLGDGTTANAITPSPALLAHMIRRPMLIDEYLLWTISDGGKKFGTDMPAFKGTLSKEQIWKIVVYLRAGLPDVHK